MQLQTKIDLETKYRFIFRQNKITKADIKTANKILIQLKNIKS